MVAVATASSTSVDCAPGILATGVGMVSAGGASTGGRGPAGCGDVGWTADDVGGVDAVPFGGAPWCAFGPTAVPPPDAVLPDGVRAGWPPGVGVTKGVSDLVRRPE